VEGADGVFLSEMDILEELEALEAFQFAEVGAVGAFEAEIVTLEEGDLFLNLRMAEGVGAVGGFHHQVFEFEAALHVPGGVDEALDGEVLEEADGLEGVEELFAEGFVFGAVGFGDDRMEIGQAMAHGIARRRGFARGRGGSRLVRHWEESFPGNEKGPVRLATHWSSLFGRVSRVVIRCQEKKMWLAGRSRDFVWQVIERMGLGRQRRREWS
jgi:hypothetical protein